MSLHKNSNKQKGIEILAAKISAAVGSEVLPHEINIAKIAQDKHGAIFTGEFNRRITQTWPTFEYAVMHDERCYCMHKKYIDAQKDARFRDMVCEPVYHHAGKYYTGDGVSVP